MPRFDKKFLNSVADFAMKQQKELSPYKNNYNQIKGALYERFQSQQYQRPITYVVAIYCNMKISAQNSKVDINDNDYQNSINDFKAEFTQNFGIEGRFLDETFDKMHDKELNNLVGTYNINECDLYEQYGTQEMKEVSNSIFAFKNLDSRLVNTNTVSFYKDQHLKKQNENTIKQQDELEAKLRPSNWKRINPLEARRTFKEITLNSDEEELPKMKKLYASVRKSITKRQWYDYILHPINTYRESKILSDIEKRLDHLGVTKDKLEEAYTDGIESIQHDIRKEYSSEKINKEKINDKDFNKKLEDLTKSPELDTSLQKSEINKQKTFTDPQKTFDIK